MPVSSHNYIQSRIALLTKHGKEALFSPLLKAAFGTTLVHTDAFDTDSLGAFDNSVQRILSPAQAALKKAYLSCELTDCTQGLGSEGSFSGALGIGNINEEVIAFVDTVNNIEVIASIKQGSAFAPIEAHDAIALKDAVSKHHPAQKWMLKMPEGLLKGLNLSQLLSHISHWPAYIEPDFRAMHCPARQKVIEMAINNLITRLNSTCPECSRVNFVPDHAVSGLPCELCSLPTQQVKYWLSKCEKCAHEVRINEARTPTSAFNCDFCNP